MGTTVGGAGVAVGASVGAGAGVAVFSATGVEVGRGVAGSQAANSTANAANADKIRFGFKGSRV